MFIQGKQTRSARISFQKGSSSEKKNNHWNIPLCEAVSATKHFAPLIWDGGSKTVVLHRINFLHIYIYIFVCLEVAVCHM